MTMRPRSLDPEAATETAVSDLLRRFDALKDPAAAPATAAAGAVIFRGPIEGTYLVAASDARAEIREVADFRCDGVADQVEINAAWQAIEDLNIGGGRVVLSAGTFSITDKVTVNTGQTEPGVMIGAGQGATLIHMASGSAAAAVRVRAGATVRDFSILVDGSTVLTTGALELTEGDAQAFSIDISTDDEQGIWIKGPRSRVEACRIATVADGEDGIYVHADAFDTILTGNHITQTRQHGIFIDGDSGGTPENTQILGNRIINPSRQTAATYDGIHMEGPFPADSLGPLIDGNTIYKDSGGDFRDGILIAAANVVDVTVVGNTIGDGVGRKAINADGVRCHVGSNRMIGGIDVGGDDNHIVGNTVAIVNDSDNGIVVGGDRNSIMDNKVFPQSGSDPAVGLEVESGATDNVIGINDLVQTTTPITDAGTDTQYRNHKALSPPFISGGVTTITGVARLRLPEDVFIIDAAAMVGTAPTDASLIVDIHLNGTTIFTTQGNRPTIASTAFDSGLAVPDVRVAAAGDYFTVDVDQVGSTIAGSDLTVFIRYVPTGVTG